MIGYYINYSAFGMEIHNDGLPGEAEV